MQIEKYVQTYETFAVTDGNNAEIAECSTAQAAELAIKKALATWRICFIVQVYNASDEIGIKINKSFTTKIDNVLFETPLQDTKHRALAYPLSSDKKLFSSQAEAVEYCTEWLTDQKEKRKANESND